MGKKKVLSYPLKIRRVWRESWERKSAELRTEKNAEFGERVGKNKVLSLYVLKIRGVWRERKSFELGYESDSDHRFCELGRPSEVH